MMIQDSRAPKTDNRLQKTTFALFGVTLALIGYLGAVGWLYDRHLVEKILTALAMPPGLLAVILLVAVIVSWSLGRRRTAAALLGLWAFYCTVSNSYMADILGGRLERNFTLADPTGTDSYEAIVVLGGGVRVSEDGDAWLNSGGDRLMLAARLHQLGKTKHLISTGSSYAWLGGANFRNGAKVIWQDLGIPASSITTIGGHNTSEEMSHLRGLLNDGNAPFDTTGRIGLITSAMHLSRALRLASGVGLEFVPIACDFKTPMDQPPPLAIVPNATAIEIVSLACKEYLAWFVGR